MKFAGDLDLFIIAYKRKVVVIERTMRENSFFQIIAEFSIVDFVPADVRFLFLIF